MYKSKKQIEKAKTGIHQKLLSAEILPDVTCEPLAPGGRTRAQINSHFININITVLCPFPVFFLRHLPLVTTEKGGAALIVLTGDLVSASTAFLVFILLEHTVVF